MQFFAHTNYFNFGPACEAAHQAWLEETTNDIEFEANKFEQAVALVADDHALVIGDEKDEDGEFFSYTLYICDEETGEWINESSDGGKAEDAMDVIKKFIAAHSQLENLNQKVIHAI